MCNNNGEVSNLYHKGDKCILTNLFCQEGFCLRCEIYTKVQEDSSNTEILNCSLNDFLTEDQLSIGINLIEDEDFVYLMNKDKVYQFYNSTKVTNYIIKNDAQQLYLTVMTNNNISFIRR